MKIQKKEERKKGKKKKKHRSTIVKGDYSEMIEKIARRKDP